MAQCPHCHEELPKTFDARDHREHIMTCTDNPKNAAKPLTGGRGSRLGGGKHRK